MNKVKVSIVVPVFNGEDFIVHCINSLRSQSLKEIEIIIVNDGSTDNTLSILNNLSSKDARIKVFSQPNKGVSSARNLGILKSTGEYISFCDSDDTYDKDFLYTLYQVAIKRDFEIVKGNTILVNSEGLTKVDPENNQIKSISNFNSKWFSAIYSSNLIKENSIFFPESISYKEDTVFLFKAKLYCKSFTKVDSVFYHYNYQRTGSLSNSVKEKSVVDAFTNLKIRADILDEYFKKRTVDPELYRNIINNIYTYYEQYKVSNMSVSSQMRIIDIIIEIRDAISKFSINYLNDLNDLNRPAVYRYFQSFSLKNFACWSDIKTKIDEPAKSTKLEELNINDKFRLKINTGNTTFEAFLLPKYNQKLYVFLSGVGHWDTTYPFFERSRWGKDLDGMVLYFDDPTRINAKLDLPYYFGTKEHDAKDQLLKIIIKICQEHLIDNKNVIFIGHSNAGFAAIYLACKLAGSSCFAYCPQFDIKTYLSNKNNDYEKFLKNLEISNQSEYKDRLNIIEIINNNLKSKIYLYSNIESKVDKDQIVLLKQFANKKLNTGYYQFESAGGGGINIWLVGIKCQRPHHAYPDQHITKFILNSNMNKDELQICLDVFAQEIFRIEMEKDLKNEAMIKLNETRTKIMEILK